MADNIHFDSRPTQISKGSDNSIPLSPQWLLPKPGESKTGVVAGENHFSPGPGHANRPDIVKLSGTGEDMNDNHRKKDVFRPSVLDMESGRRDRWRDEERDTNSSVRKDRWKEGEREQNNDNHRVDRWTDSSGGRNASEARRTPGERWTTDSGNKDNHDQQRRESKWNTRWGRDEKEAEKFGDPNKEADVHIDKMSSHLPYNGKDERGDVDHRPWRSNSSYGRGRADPHHQAATPNKQVTTFSHSHGRGENPAPVFSHGSRARVGSSGSSLTQTFTNLQSEKAESGHGDPYPLKYNRTRLLDIYRTIDMRSSAKYLDGVVEVPSLTQEDPVGPLAFCAPNPEELIILKGIDKGEIMSSGVPQTSKDGSAARTTTDFSQSRRSRHGSKDDLPNSLDDTPDNPKDGLNDSEAMKENRAIHRKTDEVSSARESSAPGYTSVPQSGPWRPSFAGRTTSHDFNNVRESSFDSPNPRKGSKWQMGDDTSIRRQPPVGFDKEVESHVISQSSPEDLVLFYKDPQGEIQGPFAGSDIITWFESGYFGIELLVRPANASADSPFRMLGDVMPHLRAKSGPPPGFSSPKSNDNQDVPGRVNYNNLGKTHTVLSEVDVLKNDPRYKHAPTTENENRFLESLMAGSLSNPPLEKFSLSEGMQGYGGNNSSVVSPMGSNNMDDPYLLAKKMAADRQRSLSNPYSFWPGRDITDVHDTSSSPAHPNARAQHLSQNVDLLSVLQGLPNRSTSNANSGWSNFPVQGGLNSLQDKVDIHQNPQSAFGLQQQRPLLQPQNSSVTNMLAQSVDNPPNMLTPEKLLSSSLPQDPQLLNLLQQQYLLQLQSQTPVPSQQLSILDKLLLLKQQQKQEEQQHQHQQLLMRQQQQQQQQLLSQMLSEHNTNQRLGDPSFAQLQAGGLGAGNTNVDHLHFQQPHDLFQMGLRQALEMRDGNANAPDFIFPSSVSQDINPNISSEPSMNLPHQIFANNQNQKNWDASLPDQMVNKHQQSNSFPTDANRYPLEQKSYYDESTDVTASAIASDVPTQEHLKESVSEQLTVGHENDQTLGLDDQQDVREQHTGVPSHIKEVKNTEARELKKKSEKKSKKQKSKLQQPKSSEVDGTNSVNAVAVALAESGMENEKTKTNKVSAADVAYLPGQNVVPIFNYPDSNDSMTIEKKDQPRQVEDSQINNQAHTAPWAWKPAPGFKPKSLLEIQQEEQRRAQEEIVVSAISTSVSSMSVASPWAGVVSNADHKSFSEATSTEPTFATSDNSSILKSKKSQEALFWDDNTKFGETEMEIYGSSETAPFVPIMSSKTDSFANDDFIEAKDTKKSRKKSKAKNAGAKVAPLASVETSVGSSPVDKIKQTRQIQQEKDVLPAVPSGPSFGDFVVWKGEPASPSPAPAWSTDSGKPNKPTSLRDILKEQGKKGPSSAQAVQVPASQKTASNQPTRGSGPSWSLSSPPAKAASPIQINSQNSSRSKQKVEDDLFWGPLEQQPKSEAKQSGFPQLGTQGSWSNKSSTPVKGTLGGSLNKHKSTSGKTADYSLASSASNTPSLQKGKKNASSKNSEAVDFKEWCESECTRLVGSTDTSFLEFCLKQSRAEAEMLLIENLGSFDPDHEFIDKFLNYKDFFPADVLEIASKNQNNRKFAPTPTPIGDMASDYVDVGGLVDGSNRGGKKKGKKGKKINPSVLGFNVVSNRIMMGEIQTVDD